MLGIGFIIARFVAMQKPQQRKYHSSCNRSVHRGTAHGKQEVKVCKRKTPHLLVRSFFVPLRGWYFNSRYSNWPWIVFAPLRGWYVRSRMVRRRDPVFAPLQGWYMMAMLWAQEIMAFAPLRGWYNLGLHGRSD